ncbi:LPS export ABC transporter permease LptG [Aestuariibacter salexigens]|uniref:LPS export ABC transporter permease LptG n=1 Tax=Aestuariibacter salexigens TaxID=226010 RepID=UPI0003FA537C|nr:LPS export ABC transporter permease LptG [Aestuariibacter salexigens]
MFKILDLYIARTLIGTVLTTLTVLVGLSALIKFVDQLRKVGQGDYDMMIAGIYVLLSLSREVEQFFPMATLLGALIGMGVLANNSELTVMQAAGLSRWNIITSAMKSAVVMILVVMAIGEFVTPVSETKAKEIRTEAISGGSLFSGDRLVWAKDGDNFVSIGEVVDQDQLNEVNIYRFNDALKLEQLLSARQALFDGQQWQLQDVQYTYFDDQQIRSEQIKQNSWLSSLTPDKLGIVAVKPEALSIRGLLDYVRYLKNNQQDPARYELALWRKVLQPVTVSVMLLVALSFIFGPLRSVTMGARVIMGVLTGFGFYIANEVFGPLSLVYQIPPVFGALLPSVVFAGIAAYLLRR